MHLPGENITNVLATATFVGGGQDTQVMLSNGSTIVFKGITRIDSGFFS